MQLTNNSTKNIPTVIISQETRHYRIVTDDPDNWHLVANRPLTHGDLVAPTGTSFDVNVCDTEVVDVLLEETRERKRVYTASHAVPNDTSCTQTTLEFPWCFMNHSCMPNTHDTWRTEAPTDLKFAETEATRNIAQGEELTYDYTLELYDCRAPFQCRCGVESCRGWILGFNGLRPEEQKQLLLRASPFVREKFRRDSILKYTDMSPLGRHLVIDYWDCDPALLDNRDGLILLLTRAAHAAGAKIVSTRSHQFERQGITAIALLAESHISIHTWPRARYAGVDIYTCGGCDPLLAHEVMAEALSVRRFDLVELARGRTDSTPSITTVSDEATLRSGLENDSAWFLEGTVPGRRHGNVNHGFNITEMVLKERTRFQECLIFDNSVFGRVLVLDGIVQLSTLDEHIYHEMLVQPPMFAHPKPRRVVIVGGGDGGTLREVLQHDPEQVVMIDIDEHFVRIAAEHLPSLSAGAFADPRVTLLFEDASEALRRYESVFDVAIIDCNDAIGPSKALFEEEFYAVVAHALKNDGTCSVQAGSMMDLELLQQTRLRMGNHLGRTTGFRLTIPSYHCGEYVFLAASRSRNPSGPDSTTLEELQLQRRIVTKHWSPAIHQASQVLPPQSTLW